jgi:hypothetical protein
VPRRGGGGANLRRGESHTIQRGGGDVGAGRSVDDAALAALGPLTIVGMCPKRGFLFVEDLGGGGGN